MKSKRSCAFSSKNCISLERALVFVGFFLFYFFFLLSCCILVCWFYGFVWFRLVFFGFLFGCCCWVFFLFSSFSGGGGVCSYF